MIRGAIFDLDGTLIDSSSYWDRAPAEYLRSAGRQARPDLDAAAFSMTVPEAADYMIKEYSLPCTRSEVIAGVVSAMEYFYLNDIPLKPGAAELLAALREHDIPCAIASVTDRHLAEAILERFGLTSYFVGIVTAEDAGAGKHEPDIFLAAAALTGSKPEETLVFEDALHAMKTAKKAGFRIAGVFDTASSGLQDEIMEISDLYLTDLKDIPAVLAEIQA